MALLFVDSSERYRIVGGCFALIFSTKYLLDYIFGLTTVVYGNAIPNTCNNKGSRFIVFIGAIVIFIMGLRFLFGYWQ